MSQRRRRKNGKGMAIAMLVMFALIIVLLIIIAFLLIRRSAGNPLKSADIQTAEYTDETTGNVLERGYIEVEKATLLTVTDAQFASFIKDIVEKEGYARFTIQCGDSTGIVFDAGTDYLANYGYVGADGAVTEVFGQITEVSGGYHYTAW